jgi:hypothetical protein
MISTDGGIAAPLYQFNDSIPGEFKCFDPIDEDDTGDDDLIEDKSKKVETVFFGTGFGSDTFVTPEPAKKKETLKKAANNNRERLEEYPSTGFAVCCFIMIQRSFITVNSKPMSPIGTERTRSRISRRSVAEGRAEVIANWSKRRF